MNIHLVCSGRTLPQYIHEGREYVAAPSGEEYQIVLHNSSSWRQLAVVSIDGVNIVNAKDASSKGAGYIIKAHDSVTIKGWTRTSSEVAAFAFGAQDDSYANKTGRGTANNGVIGVAIYNEKRKSDSAWLHTRRVVTRSRRLFKGQERARDLDRVYRMRSFSCSVPDKGQTKASSRGHSGSPMSSFDASMDLGTGYGQATEMHTRNESFEAASQSPCQRIELFYATKERLTELGVLQQRPSGLPSAFPQDDIGCPAPAGWPG